MEPIRFHINDTEVVEEHAAPTTTVLDYVREYLALTGTKEGCAEGDCGACTIAILESNDPNGPSFRAVNSCLMLLPMIHGRRIYTVEGLRAGSTYHPAQVAMAEALGSQCGFCTPGIVMSIFEATYRKDLDAPWKVDDQLCGNLCRCTGYRPIRDALQKVAGTCPADRFQAELERAVPVYPSLRYCAEGTHYFAPGTPTELFDILDQHPDHRFVCGATDLGLEVTKRHATYNTLIALDALPALREINLSEDVFSVGAAVPLSEVEAAAEGPVPTLARILRFFGARQIKNRATIGGNICNASPIGDTAPVLISLDANVVLLSRAGERIIPLEAFFLDYRKTALEKGEILARVEVPIPMENSLLGAYKVSKRRELDISAVCAGFRVNLDDGGKVTAASFVYGGMAATTKRAVAAEAAVVGELWSEECVERAMEALDGDFTPIDDHRGSTWYRMRLAKNFLRGFYLETRTVPVRSLPDHPCATVLMEESG